MCSNLYFEDFNKFPLLHIITINTFSQIKNKFSCKDELQEFDQQSILLPYTIMRSLYVEDIPGAQPKRHVFDKKVYRQKHEEQILRFAKNPQEKRVIDWYVPLKKPTEPLNRDDEDIWRTKRTMRKSLDSHLAPMSKSTVLTRQSFGSQHDIQSKLAKSSVLMSSGQGSLNTSRKIQQDPYFPHRYVDPKMGESNRWSGSRMWQNQATTIVKLPSVDQCYFKKWF